MYADLPQDNGSDVRQLTPAGIYRSMSMIRATQAAATPESLEARALMHKPGSYGYNVLMGHAARLRKGAR